MRKFNNTKLVLSVIALVLVLIMAAGFTFSWVEGGNKGYINGNEIVISSGSSLTMRQDGLSTDSIIIPNCILEEVSSADGRNYFFPMADNKTNVTSNMKFREGVAADAKTKYVSVDFELEAGTTVTDVYLGAGTIIQCDNKDVLNALRMSFNLNNGSDPIVFKPTQMPGVQGMTYSPITAISNTGTPTVKETVTHGYGDYYYNGENISEPIFTLDINETLNITLSIWLEGTEFDGTVDVSDTNLSVYIDFTTTVDDLFKYTFIDNCRSRGSGELNQWVSNNMEKDEVEYETMVYLYDNKAERYYALKSQGEGSHTWVGYIPNTINNFFFRRYSIDIDEWWNEWEPSMIGIPTINNERTFVAIAGQEIDIGTRLDGCYGYWKDSQGTYRIYFEMQAPYSNLHCYAWDSSGNPCPSTGAWPGGEMTFVKNTTNGVLYYIEFNDNDKIAGLQFNNGGETRVYLEGFDYSVNTSAYVHFTDSNGVKKEPLGVWAGTLASYDASNTTGKYWVEYTVSNVNQDKTFYIIANNHINNTGTKVQYPTSGGAEGQNGRVYRFTNNNMTLEKLAEPFNIPSADLSKMTYNGAAFWLKSNGSYGYYVYTGEEESQIYPVNDPTPKT